MTYRTPIVALLFTFVGTVMALAQDYSEAELLPEQIVKLKLHKSQAGQTALSHRLYPSNRDMFDRNAAVFYHRAIYLFDRTEAGLHAQATDSTNSPGYSGDFASPTLTPELIQRIRNWLSLYESTDLIDDIGFATRSRQCDWQIFPQEADKAEWFLRTIPEVQGCRGLARYLAAKARIEIIDQQYPQACKTIQCGYRMGANLHNSKLLVGSLVGLACIDIMRKPLLELMQCEEGPNLYWALASLPPEMTDIRPSIRAELSVIREGMGLDLLDNPEKGRTPEQWRIALNDYNDRMLVISAVTDPQFAVQPSIASSYPVAKQMLLDMGKEQAEVDAMNSIQVVAIANQAFTHRLIDEYEKGLTLGFRKGSQYFAELEQNEIARATGGKHVADYPVLWHTTAMVPAVGAIYSVGAKAQRQLASLQVLEAIRLHYGETGELPGSLNEIKVVQVPRNPETEAPFRYMKSGSTAKLFDFGQNSRQANVYEITTAGK